MKKIGISILLGLLVMGLFTSCITSTRVIFDSNVQDAKVYIDGEYIGNTPVEKEMTNNSFYEPLIVMKKEGYDDSQRVIQKEIKLVNAITGYLFLFPLLWCYGPKVYQYMNLYEKE